MISYHNGDLLESGCDIICQQCNFESLFTSGLAYIIARRYKDIEQYCSSQGKQTIGNFIAYKTPNRVILNCYTQDDNYNTDYNALEICFNKVKEFIKQLDNNKQITIGIPYNYGCGIANGDWFRVEYIFKTIFANEDKIDLQIWKL